MCVCVYMCGRMSVHYLCENQLGVSEREDDAAEVTVSLEEKLRVSGRAGT